MDIARLDIRIKHRDAFALRCLVVLVITGFFFGPVQAADSNSSDTSSRSELELRLKQLEENENNLTRSEILEELKKWYELASARKWDDLRTVIAGQKAEILVEFSKLGEVEPLINEHLPLADTFKLYETKLRLLQTKLHIVDAKLDASQSKEVRQSLLDMIALMSDPAKRAAIYLYVGQSFNAYQILDDALRYLIKAIEIFENLDDKKGIAAVASGVASIHAKQDDHRGAITYYQKALEISEERGDQLHTSILLFNIGNEYFNMENFKKAEGYLEKSLALSLNIDDEIGVAYVTRILGEIKSLTGEHNKAIEYYQTSIDIFKKHKNTGKYFASSVSLLNTLNEIGKLSEAGKLIDELKPLAESMTKTRYVLYFYRAYYIYLKNIEDYRAALEAMEAYINLLKKRNDEDKKQSIEDLMVRYDTKQQEAENKLLQQANELKALRLSEKDKQQKIILLLFALSLFLLCVVAFVLYKQVKIQRRFKSLALRDHLTGAPNRRAVLTRAESCVENYREVGERFLLALLDIDHFKRINDNFGHDVGDEVLKAFAAACDDCLRNNDYYGRYGGEEWMLVLSNASLNHVPDIFSRISTHLRDSQIAGVPDDHMVTFSMGVCEIDEKNGDLDALIREADTKLYQAKQGGRNRFIT